VVSENEKSMGPAERRQTLRKRDHSRSKDPYPGQDSLLQAHSEAKKNPAIAARNLGMGLRFAHIFGIILLHVS